MIIKPCDIIYQLYDALEGFDSTDIVIQTLDKFSEDVSNGCDTVSPQVIYQHIMSTLLPERHGMMEAIGVDKLSRLSRTIFSLIPLYIQWKLLEKINGLKPVKFDRNHIYYTDEILPKNHLWGMGSTMTML